MIIGLGNQGNLEDEMNIAIPSYNSPKSLVKCIENIQKHSPDSRIYVCEDVTRTNVDVHWYCHNPVPVGVGGARRLLTEEILKEYPDDILLQLDDNSKVGEGAIDRVRTAMENNPEFAWIGALNAYKHWMVSSGISMLSIEEDIHFINCIGACFSAINPRFIHQCGNFSYLAVREDAEMCFRAWANGWYVGMIDVKFTHTRAKNRTVDNPFHPKSKTWKICCQYIAATYPNHAKFMGKNKLGKLFKFPEEVYKVDG
jgi:GT2 family glycosyltransferase